MGRARSRSFRRFCLTPLVFFAAMLSPVAAQENNVEAFLGGYLGTHVGYGASESIPFTGDPYQVTVSADPDDDPVSVPGRRDRFALDGFIGGFHAGYNFVSDGTYLFGIEGDWTYLGLNDRVSAVDVIAENLQTYTLAHRSKVEMDWQATIRGRAGIIHGNTLFFATAGVGFLDVDWRETATLTDDVTLQTTTQKHRDSKVLVGFVVGGGFEMAVSEDVTIGADYLYENFGNYGSVPFGHTSPSQIGRLGEIELHKVRARLTINLGTP